MKFYCLVISLALVLAIGVTYFISKNRSKSCGCSYKFEEEFEDAEEVVERLG
jgi:hypothetical protein